MAEKNSAPTRSGAARLRRRRTSSATPSVAKSRGLFLAVLVVFLVGAGLGIKGRDFIANVYSPFVIVVLLFLAIEYIVLKGRDRSRIYRIELDQAHRKRQDDLEFLRRLESELLQVQKTLDASSEKSPGSENVPSSPELEQASSELEQARARLAALRRELSDKL